MTTGQRHFPVVSQGRSSVTDTSSLRFVPLEAVYQTRLPVQTYFFLSLFFCFFFSQFYDFFGFPALPEGQEFLIFFCSS